MSVRTWVCNLQHTSSYLRPDDMEVDTNEPEHFVQEIHDKTVVSHCCLHRPPFMCIYTRQRLRYVIPVGMASPARESWTPKKPVSSKEEFELKPIILVETYRIKDHSKNIGSWLAVKAKKTLNPRKHLEFKDCLPKKGGAKRNPTCFLFIHCSIYIFPWSARGGSWFVSGYTPQVDFRRTKWQNHWSALLFPMILEIRGNGGKQMELNIKQKNGCLVAPTTIFGLLLQKTRGTPTKTIWSPDIDSKKCAARNGGWNLTKHWALKSDRRQILEPATFMTKPRTASKISWKVLNNLGKICDIYCGTSGPVSLLTEDYLWLPVSDVCILTYCTRWMLAVCFARISASILIGAPLSTAKEGDRDYFSTSRHTWCQEIQVFCMMKNMTFNKYLLWSQANTVSMNFWTSACAITCAMVTRWYTVHCSLSSMLVASIYVYTCIYVYIYIYIRLTVIDWWPPCNMGIQSKFWRNPHMTSQKMKAFMTSDTT